MKGLFDIPGVFIHSRRVRRVVLFVATGVGAGLLAVAAGLLDVLTRCAQGGLLGLEEHPRQALLALLEGKAEQLPVVDPDHPDTVIGSLPCTPSWEPTVRSKAYDSVDPASPLV